jgi:hypothetical protein
MLRLRIIGVTNPLQQTPSWHACMQAALLRVLILLVYSSKQQE